MTRFRRHLLRLAVALMAIQGSGFAVPASVVSCTPRGGGSCTCCRPGSGATCPMCRRMEGAAKRCTCVVAPSGHFEELPWLFGIAAVLPPRGIPVLALACVSDVLDADAPSVCFHRPPPSPPPRA